ncbi:MAG: hypothetical protein COS08_06930 [Euryarchaeota archaeon CG01_land_8_20_14_3_00_38_12]|nr:MAG: hypothetical protein COS08_06930 [Euryarchaeota archaeon CG01_land_8_20_14_3_00_38_12]
MLTTEDHLFPVGRIENKTDKALLATVRTFLHETRPVWVPLSIMEEDRNGNMCVPEWWLRRKRFHDRPLL